MDNLEFNKGFAAVLCAGIAVMLGWFVAGKLVHPHMLHEDAVAIESLEVAVGGAVKAQVPDPVMALIATADVAKGEKLSKACAACHSFDNGGVSKVGPNLYAVVGAPMGGKAGFSYSAGMAGYGKSWGYDELNYFLWKPKALISDTKMNFAGLKKASDRADVIAWLRSNGSTGFPNPSAAAIAAEEAALAPAEEETPAEADAENTATEAAAPAAH